MQHDIRAMLEKQAEWQRARASKPWAEKLRESVTMRGTLMSLREKSSTVYQAKPKSG